MYVDVYVYIYTHMYQFLYADVDIHARTSATPRTVAGCELPRGNLTEHVYKYINTCYLTKKDCFIGLREALDRLPYPYTSQLKLPST